MNFLKTTVDPCTSVVKKTRVLLPFPKSGTFASSKRMGRREQNPERSWTLPQLGPIEFRA
jgi:hypothetical protein